MRRDTSRILLVAVVGGSAATSDNFATLDGRSWQVHVYGEAGSDLEQACRRFELALHLFPWRSAMRRAGLTRNALYLVRPDGHVAFADASADPDTLEPFVAAVRGPAHVRARPAQRGAAQSWPST